MEYQIVFPPDLGLTPAEFAAAWNGTQESRAAAQAQVTRAPGNQFDPTLLMDGAMVVLGNIALGIAANALYDLIKDTLAKKGIRKRTEIVQLDQPDGSHLLIVKIDEE